MTLQRINGSRGHWYKIDGVKADGVTTLIGGGLPKPALPNWAARTVAEYAADNAETIAEEIRVYGRDQVVRDLKGIPWAQARAAAAKGTEVHDLAAQIINGAEVDVPEPLVGYVEGYVRFLDRFKVEPILVETTVGHRKWNYCGSFDLVARVRGITSICDIKTSGSGVYQETALQLAAYRYADVYLDDQGTEQPMQGLDIERGYAIWCRPDGTDLIPVACGDLAFKRFLHVAYVARAAWDMKDNSPIGEIIYE